MAALIVSAKLTAEEAIGAMRSIVKWFADNPKRNVCRTDRGWAVHRGTIARDILDHTTQTLP